MSDANRIVDAILDAISARDEDTRREAGELLETVIHEIACAHATGAVKTALADHPTVAAQTQTQELPDGWTREPNDGYGPVFRDTRPAYRSCAVTVECEDLEQKAAHITTNDDYCIIPIAVLRAFLAALDG